MAVTANQMMVAQKPDCLISYPVLDDAIIYDGTLVFGVAASGYATSVIAAGANHFLGVANQEVDNTDGGDGGARVECWTEGVFELQGSGFTQALVGDKIYAVDNFTVNATSASQTLIGRCVEFVSATKIMVKIEVGVQA